MIRRIFPIAALALMAAFTSCREDEDPQPLTAEESAQVLNTVGTDANSLMAGVTASPGMTGMNALMQLPSLPFEAGLKSILAVTETSVAKGLSVEGRSGLAAKLKSASAQGAEDLVAAHAGTWSWNARAQQWGHSPEPTNRIVLLYPAERSLTNNCELTIHTFTQVAIVDGEFTYYYPTAIELDLKVNNVLAADLDFAATYDAYGDPLTINVNLQLVPYTITLSYRYTALPQGSQMKITASLKEGNRSLLAGDVTVTLRPVTVTDEWGTFTYDEPIRLVGWVQLSQLKATVDANLEPLLGEEEPTVAQLNEAIKIALYQYPSEAKIADVRFDPNPLYPSTQAEPFIVMLVFADGSAQPAEAFFANLLENVEVTPIPVKRR